MKSKTFMRSMVILPVAVVCLSPLHAESSRHSVAPSYSATSIVNSATYIADALAPGTIGTIFGNDLSYNTAVGLENVQNSVMPVTLGGVRVFVAGVAAPLYYVSPTQINFLIPGNLRPGEIDLFLAREGTAGPHVKITLHDAGPGLFQWDPGMIASVHGEGGPITSENPAHGGETVVLYGTGFGKTDPDVTSAQINLAPAEIVLRGELRVLVDGIAVEPAKVLYAGATPGFPGLYQVNVRLPAAIAHDPEIRIVIGDSISPADFRIPGR
jgi:uncharacterized protein (TIGR03437 family)